MGAKERTSADAAASFCVVNSMYTRERDGAAGAGAAAATREAAAAGGAGAAAAAAAEKEEEEIERKYTPVTGDETKGFVDLVVKVYRKGEDTRYPDGGKMSQYLHALQPGQCVDVQGPVGRIEYLGRGCFSVSRKLLPEKKKVVMLAGGTGITPMFQLLRAVLCDAADSTSLTLLYASKTAADILLKPELDALAQQHKERLQIHYTVAAASSSWTSFRGFIDRCMLQQTLPPPPAAAAPAAVADMLILVCGSPIMVNCCRRDLLQLGYRKEDILDF